jgi:hypothetical protein
LTLAIQKVSHFPLIFNYRKNFAEVRSASFHLHKRLLKSFGRSVEIWYDFLKVAILVSLGCWQLNGFQRGAPSYWGWRLYIVQLAHRVTAGARLICTRVGPNNDAGETSVPSVDSAVKMSEPIWQTFLVRNALLSRTARQSPRSWPTTCPPTLTSSGSVEM